MATLTKNQVDSFRENGYCLFKDQVFPPDRFRELQDIFDDHLADKGDKLSDELDTPHFRDPRLLPFLMSDHVLNLVEPLVGPNIALWTSHFISKEPRTGRATPWHEDSAFWEGRLSAYDRIVTVWLALSPSTRENGCMRVVPGTHHSGFSEYQSVSQKVNTFRAEIIDVDESEAIYFELEPGECSLHDGRIIHGAAPNTSDIRRTGYTMRYFPASVEVLPVERNEGWKIWLARGEGLADNTYANV